MEVERLQLAPEDRRVSRRLGQKTETGSEEHQDQAEVSLSWDQPPTQAVDGKNQRDRTRNPGEVVGGNQRQMQEGGQVTEEEIEAEEEDPTVRFAGVGIGPQPRARRTLAHL